MGYMNLRVNDSDIASDACDDMEQVMITALRKILKGRPENEFNTDPIINVAMILDEVIISNPFWSKSRHSGDDFRSFSGQVAVKLEKYIEHQKKADWDDEANKNWHLENYQRLLKRLKKYADGKVGAQLKVKEIPYYGFVKTSHA